MCFSLLCYFKISFLYDVFSVVATEKLNRLLTFSFKGITTLDTEDLCYKFQLPRSKAFKNCVFDENSYGTFTWWKDSEVLNNIL